MAEDNKPYHILSYANGPGKLECVSDLKYSGSYLMWSLWDRQELITKTNDNNNQLILPTVILNKLDLETWAL
jgi:hypothetical protein